MAARRFCSVDSKEAKDQHHVCVNHDGRVDWAPYGV